MTTGGSGKGSQDSKRPWQGKGVSRGGQALSDMLGLYRRNSDLFHMNTSDINGSVRK